ncbi:Saccharopine dehydrogenase [Venturia nashicola]|uniref:Small ribosomal subunit protein mS38 n=1 Tax=Venturia nashicola TaxID=86259 RepID=A0A4Z1NS14_9PEZI|nr:Saccharopine dehydrogenase [Venturia nashicola]
MFSSSLGRAVRTVPASAISARAARAAPSAPSITAFRPLTQCTRQRQSGHQRRHSSSKTSIPPDGSKVVAPAQRATSTGRTTRKKSKDATAPRNDQNQPFSIQYPHIPSVPSTKHLRPQDVTLSSFFSLHRPISLTTALPPESTEAQFNSIFEPPTLTNREKFTKVISTLGGFADNLESAIVETDEDGNITWQTIEQEADMAQGELRRSSGSRGDPMQHFMTQFKPFRPPPPPQPLNELASASSKARSKRAAPAPKKGRSWSTTITITEYTNHDGKIMYANAVAEPIAIAPSSPHKQPFLHRMGERERAWQQYRDERSQRVPSKKPEMKLISVKRQRKLKMKKHKYKKLMKRTRNERRKLGKL